MIEEGQKTVQWGLLKKPGSNGNPFCILLWSSIASTYCVIFTDLSQFEPFFNSPDRNGFRSRLDINEDKPLGDDAALTRL
jgi:hypothetical protein